MSINLFSRLKALLPAPPVWVATVVAHNADGTSTLELPTGVAGSVVAPGLSTGPTLLARGVGVPVGERAFVRAGVIEGPAPSGAISEHVVGVVAEQPFGPAALALGAPITPPAAALGVPYELDLAPGWTGGYPPRAYALTAGTLPAGLTLDPAAGKIQGTRTAAGAASGLVVTCTDSTNRSVPSAPFAIA